MSSPLCYTHGEMAVYRDLHGYWFCPLCLRALSEWNQWIRDNLVSPDLKAEMMEKNKEIADAHRQSARDFALRLPESVDPRFLRYVMSERPVKKEAENP